MMRSKIPILAATALLAGCVGVHPAFDPEAEEGVHGDVEIEWWYHYGWLEDEDGGRWAWVSSFFRTVRPKTGLARYLITDLINLDTGQGHFRSRIGTELFTAAGIPVPKLQAPHEPIPGKPLERPGDPLKLRYGTGDCEITRAFRGVQMEGAADNVVEECDISESILTGVRLRDSDRNTFVDLELEENPFGVFVDIDSEDNVFDELEVEDSESCDVIDFGVNTQFRNSEFETFNCS